MENNFKNGLSALILDLRRDTVLKFIDEVKETVAYDERNAAWNEVIYSKQNANIYFDIFMRKNSDESFSIMINDVCFNSKNIEKISYAELCEIEDFLYADDFQEDL
jgi:hypothetical protein